MKLLVALALVALLLSGCSGGGSGPVVPEQDDQGRYMVDMVGQKFVPAHIKIPANSTVVWKNTSSIPHDVTQDGGGFSSDEEMGHKLSRDMTYTHTFAEPGKFSYYCELHHAQKMQGTVTVE